MQIVLIVLGVAEDRGGRVSVRVGTCSASPSRRAVGVCTGAVVQARWPGCGGIRRPALARARALAKRMEAAGLRPCGGESM